jgi:hypothetical protein
MAKQPGLFAGAPTGAGGAGSAGTSGNQILNPSDFSSRTEYLNYVDSTQPELGFFEKMFAFNPINREPDPNQKTGIGAFLGDMRKTINENPEMTMALGRQLRDAFNRREALRLREVEAATKPFAGKLSDDIIDLATPRAAQQDISQAVLDKKNRERRDAIREALARIAGKSQSQLATAEAERAKRS